MLDEVFNGLKILRKNSGSLPMSLKTEGHIGFLSFDLKDIPLSSFMMQRLKEEGWIIYKGFLSYPLLLETMEKN